MTLTLHSEALHRLLRYAPFATEPGLDDVLALPEACKPHDEPQLETCPVCGWFIHYDGNPQHADCRKAQEMDLMWAELEALKDECRKHNESIDRLEAVTIRAFAVRFFGVTSRPSEDPYALMWRYRDLLDSWTVLSGEQFHSRVR